MYPHPFSRTSVATFLLASAALLPLSVGPARAACDPASPASGDTVVCSGTSGGIQDNGIDGLVNANEPTSADELNRIAVGDIGEAIEDFGFPDDFVPYRTGGQGGSDDSLLVAFQPIPDPSDGMEAEGANEIAFAPDTFRSILGHGVFIGFHGRFNGAPSGVDAENPRVFYDIASDSYIHFIEGNQDGLGHLDGLLATSDRLYISDLSTIGPVTFGGAGQGVIYVLTAVIPEPSSLALTALGLAGLLGLAARRPGRPRVG